MARPGPLQPAHQANITVVTLMWFLCLVQLQPTYEAKEVNQNTQTYLFSVTKLYITIIEKSTGLFKLNIFSRNGLDVPTFPPSVNAFVMVTQGNSREGGGWLPRSSGDVGSQIPVSRARRNNTWCCRAAGLTVEW